MAVLVYGFPPNVGATGTAALLNVPRSLKRLLGTLRTAGYDLGPSADSVDGEAIVAALKLQEDQRAILEGSAGIAKRCVWGSGFWVCRPNPQQGLRVQGTMQGSMCTSRQCQCVLAPDMQCAQHAALERPALPGFGAEWGGCAGVLGTLRRPACGRLPQRWTGRRCAQR